MDGDLRVESTPVPRITWCTPSVCQKLGVTLRDLRYPLGESLGERVLLACVLGASRAASRYRCGFAEKNDLIR